MNLAAEDATITNQSIEVTSFEIIVRSNQFVVDSFERKVGMGRVNRFHYELRNDVFLSDS